MKTFFRSAKGQATTEVVLLFPVFMIILFITAKVFALLVLVQKLEISSYYAARRWQLESHRNFQWTAWDDGFLKKDIEAKVRGYIGFDNAAVKGFLSLRDLELSVERTQVWQVVTLTVRTKPAGIKLLCKYNRERVCASPYGADCKRGYDFLCTTGGNLSVIKYVPNRDRPIQFELPGLQ